MTAQVLHLDLASLSPTTSARDRDDIIEAAGCLTSLPDVTAAGVIEGVPEADFELAFFFVLAEPAALERFGTDPAYSRFLRGKLAPRLRAFAGADARLEADFEASGQHGACLALEAPEETYDWEVAEALNRWAEGTGAAARAVGLAAGERQRFRGVALAFTATPFAPERPAEGRFGATLVWGRTRRLP